MKTFSLYGWSLATESKDCFRGFVLCADERMFDLDRLGEAVDYLDFRLPIELWSIPLYVGLPEAKPVTIRDLS